MGGCDEGNYFKDEAAYLCYVDLAALCLGHFTDTVMILQVKYLNENASTKISQVLNCNSGIEEASKQSPREGGFLQRNKIR